MKFTVCLLFGMSVAAQTGTPAASASSPEQGLRDAGRDLFTGAVHFDNGGPACVACHNVAGLGFPGGGSMGPDLTGAYAKLGPDGLNSALETLYFPAMTPLFAYRPLTPDERRNLAAYFQGVNGQQSGTPTPAIGAIALVGPCYWSLQPESQDGAASAPYAKPSSNAYGFRRDFTHEECCWMHGEKRGPGMQIRWKHGPRLWTIRRPAGNIRLPEAGAVSMDVWVLDPERAVDVPGEDDPTGATAWLVLRQAGFEFRVVRWSRKHAVLSREPEARELSSLLAFLASRHRVQVPKPPLLQEAARQEGAK